MVHHALKHGAEDGRGDERPVKIAAFQQDGAHFGVEPGRRERFPEERAVNIAEAAELLWQVGHSALGRGVEHGEKLQQALGEAGTIRVGGLNVIAEAAFLKDAGVIGKEAEKQAHKEHLKGVAGVVFLFERVVQAGEFLRVRVTFAAAINALTYVLVEA